MKRIIRGIIIGLFLVGIIGVSSPARIYARTLFIMPADNEVDPVDGTPITKNSQFKAAYANKFYRFNTFENLKKFKEDPERYIKNLESLQKSGPTRTVTSSRPAETAPEKAPAPQPNQTRSNRRSAY